MAPVASWHWPWSGGPAQLGRTIALPAFLMAHIQLPVDLHEIAVGQIRMLSDIVEGVRPNDLSNPPASTSPSCHRPRRLAAIAAHTWLNTELAVVVIDLKVTAGQGSLLEVIAKNQPLLIQGRCNSRTAPEGMVDKVRPVRGECTPCSCKEITTNPGDHPS